MPGTDFQHLARLLALHYGGDGVVDLGVYPLEQRGVPKVRAPNGVVVALGVKSILRARHGVAFLIAQIHVSVILFGSARTRLGSVPTLHRWPASGHTAS